MYSIPTNVNEYDITLILIKSTLAYIVRRDTMNLTLKSVSDRTREFQMPQNNMRIIHTEKLSSFGMTQAFQLIVIESNVPQHLFRITKSMKMNYCRRP